MSIRGTASGEGRFDQYGDLDSTIANQAVGILQLRVHITFNQEHVMKLMYRLVPGLIALLTITTHAAELKYTIAPGFFEEKPDGKQLGPCHGGMVVDVAGNIYVTTDTERGIIVYSPAGKFLRAFGPTRIHGLEIRKEKGVEYIYAARPSDHEVLKLKLDGEQVWAIHYPSEAGIYKDANGFKPCAVTVGPDDSIYVADGYGSNYVLKFDKDRKFIKAFGGPGPEEGKFNTCHGIGLDTRQGKPLLLVCNRNNNRVEHWDLDGNFVRVIQKDLRMPAAVQFRGDYAIFPELQGRVTVLDKAGNIAAQVGDNPEPKQRANFGLPPDQWKDGICNSPHGATMDKDHNILVSEWSKFGHLHKFVPAK
jgi:DNA-binding beta-propeller fold protein YncE